MSKYFCKYCNYDAKIKGNYDKHLKTKKHQKVMSCHHFDTPNSPFCHHFDTISPKIVKKPHLFRCKYCDKKFKHRQGMYRHIKYSCPNNKDEDFKELARLLNQKNNEIKEMIDSKNNELDRMQKQIDKLTNRLQIKNIVTGNIINNNVINVQLLNFNQTDYSHLTDKDYVTCINDTNHCVQSLIEKVHFNDTKPENMNIYISNLKGNYIMIFKDNEWQIQDKKEKIDDLYEYNEMVLENWYDECKEKYPNIIQSFQNYLKNKDESDTINDVKNNILLMLYNKRKMVNQNNLLE